jgi:hypothetical protein
VIQLQFFSLLASAGIVSPSSLLEVYKSLLSVLSEVGGGGDRAERVNRAVSEGLIRVSSLSQITIMVKSSFAFTDTDARRPARRYTTFSLERSRSWSGASSHRCKGGEAGNPCPTRSRRCCRSVKSPRPTMT